MFRLVMVGRVRAGGVWQVKARRGAARAAWRGGAGMARWGAARFGQLWLGEAGMGMPDLLTNISKSGILISLAPSASADTT